MSKAPPSTLGDNRAKTEASLLLTPEAAGLIRRVQDALISRGCRAFLVGGTVRDALLGRPTGDIDLAVEGNVAEAAQAVALLLRGALVPLGPAHQTHRVVERGGPHHIDLTLIRNDIAGDALERDFTVNALAVPLAGLDPFGGRAGVIDVTGGLEDLERRQVRAVSDSVFLADGARLLRAVRLAAELGFSIERHTEGLVKRDANRIASVSSERVRDEFCKVLRLPLAAVNLRVLDSLGLLTKIIPELKQARDVAQPKEHYWDVLQHSIEATGAVEEVVRQRDGDPGCLGEVPWDDELTAYFAERTSADRDRATILKVAALLHDIAKPSTKTVEPGGRIRFLGHPGVGAGVSRQIMERLRFSGRETQMVSIMVREHLRAGLISRDEEGPTRRALYRFFRDAGDVGVDVLFLSLADYLAARGPLLDLDDWREYAGKIREMLDRRRDRTAEVLPPRIISGLDLMRELGLGPGPVIGDLLAAVTEAQAAGEVGDRGQALILARGILDQRAAA